MGIKLQLPKVMDVKPRITVIGVGGAGCNAVNNMIATGLKGVEFVVANTDAQALASSSAEHRLQLGTKLTEGLGAGSKPEIGEAAAEEASEEIRGFVAGSHMVFIAAGMGGGTGTGAAAVIARIAKELGILTVAIVTKPFLFEGARRMRIAEAGVAEIRKHVDTLIVIPNQNLFRVASEKTTFAEAFVMADQVLYSGVACIVDLIIREGLINLDFADVRTVMRGMGAAMMGTGEASGERRATLAAEEALSNPLLDDVSLKGAKGLLLSITGGPNLTLYEVDEAASRVRQEVDPEANIIVGATFDETFTDRVRVSIVASGMARMDEMDRAQAARVEAASWPRSASAPPAQAFRPEPDPARGRREARTGNDDLERRLGEALQYGAPPAPGYRNAQMPPPLPPSDEGAGRRPRETWRAPGNVLIEEGPPKLPVAAYMPPPLPQAAPPAHPVDSFTPAPPTEVRRAPRRMPEVEDFPPVAQRVYRAMETSARSERAQATAEGSAWPQQEIPRRAGFFERFAGRVLGEGESPRRERYAEDVWPPPDQQLAQGRRAEPHPDERGGGAREQSRGAQEPELPVFFSRERR
jgi:cell division protein FtsZ